MDSDRSGRLAALTFVQPRTSFAARARLRYLWRASRLEAAVFTPSPSGFGRMV
jgi:hypothetical protein